MIKVTVDTCGLTDFLDNFSQDKLYCLIEEIRCLCIKKLGEYYVQS